MTEKFIEQLRDKIGNYCFQNGCHYSKQSEVYNECKNSEKCQIWQFLKWSNKLEGKTK